MDIEIKTKELREFLNSLKLVYGYDFTEYSEASLKRRIENFMKNEKIYAIDSLAKIVLKSENDFEHFIQELSVTVTEMFRDPEFFLSMREIIIKRLATYPFLKIWIAGCATGEEIYSLAIILKEENLLDRSIIYATDINQRSLHIAKEGIYSMDRMKKYTDNYIKSGGKGSFSDYYKAKYNSVIFDKSLKQNVVISPHNLTVDKCFNEFQLVICRNVMIYFNRELQCKIIELFYESLCRFGILGLGNKESLLFSDKKKNFEDINRKEKIFMKVE